MTPKLSLNIGRDPVTNTWWLCLANMDNEDIAPLAQFQSKETVDLFTKFMETEGYASLNLPSQEELNRFFE